MWFLKDNKNVFYGIEKIKLLLDWIFFLKANFSQLRYSWFMHTIWLKNKKMKKKIQQKIKIVNIKSFYFLGLYCFHMSLIIFLSTIKYAVMPSKTYLYSIHCSCGFYSYPCITDIPLVWWPLDDRFLLLCTKRFWTVSKRRILYSYLVLLYLGGEIYRLRAILQVA